MTRKTAYRKIVNIRTLNPSADTQDFLLAVFVIGALISNLIAALS